MSEPNVLKPQRDAVTRSLLRPLDWGDAFHLATVQSKRPDAHPLRMGASEIGKCLRELHFRREVRRLQLAIQDANAAGDHDAVTSLKLDLARIVPPDEMDELVMDLGIAERGHAVEAHQTRMMREVHGEDQVLQNVPLSKWFDIPHPLTGENVRVAISTATDPVIIGDNLRILALYEIKTKGFADWFGKIQSKWAELEMVRGKPRYDPAEPVKVPLFMFQVEEKQLGIEGASLHNGMQVAVEARIFRENDRDPGQVLLEYILPDNLNVHLTALLSRSDVDVLSELAFLWLRQFFHYYLQNKLPPALFTMSWQCNYCPFKAACPPEERQLNPLFVDVNERLDKARKTKESTDLLTARERFQDARSLVRLQEDAFAASLVADLPVSVAPPPSVAKKGAK